MSSILGTNLFSHVINKINWGNSRISVLNENISNANTPKYIPKDLLEPEKTNSKLQTFNTDSSTKTKYFKTVSREIAKISSSGGSVDLNEQLSKLQETYSENYLLTTSFKRIVDMYKTVLRR